MKVASTFASFDTFYRDLSFSLLVDFMQVQHVDDKVKDLLLRIQNDEVYSFVVSGYLIPQPFIFCTPFIFSSHSPHTQEISYGFVASYITLINMSLTKQCLAGC